MKTVKQHPLTPFVLMVASVLLAVVAVVFLKFELAALLVISAMVAAILDFLYSR